LQVLLLWRLDAAFLLVPVGATVPRSSVASRPKAESASNQKRWQLELISPRRIISDVQIERTSEFRLGSPFYIPPIIRFNAVDEYCPF